MGREAEMKKRNPQNEMGKGPQKHTQWRMIGGKKERKKKKEKLMSPHPHKSVPSCRIKEIMGLNKAQNY